MPNYTYEYREISGRIATGAIQAASMSEATAVLRDRGLFVVNLSGGGGGAAGVLAKLRSVSFEFGPGLKDILNFTRELAVMIKAGISIREAIDGISRQVANPKFKSMILQIKADVEAGQPFSSALAKYPKVFSPLYVNMAKASEMSGNFGHMLERIAGYLMQQHETRNMVRGAMVYPCIIAFMAISTTTFLLTWVLPKFMALFAGKESLLPMPTIILIGIGAFLRDQWYLVVGGLGILIGSVIYAVHTPKGRVVWDRCKLKLPLFKRMFRALYITRGLHTMGELVNAGVPMLEVLTITAEVSGNVIHKRMWMSVHQSVKQGEKIAGPLGKFNLLPASVVQMISAGEESGKLGEVMADVAEYYSVELKNTIKAVTSMIEPLMIVVMGFVVGFIAMSIILPIFKMSSLVK